MVVRLKGVSMSPLSDAMLWLYMLGPEQTDRQTPIQDPCQKQALMLTNMDLISSINSIDYRYTSEQNNQISVTFLNDIWSKRIILLKK